MTDNLGELAALATAFCWAGSALFFEASARRIGSLPVNLLRFPVALAALAIAAALTRGLALPTDASADTWLWLGVSGFVGFTLGDLCLFRAFVLIGPRLSSLIMSISPVFAALFGWVFLDERLTLIHWFGMAMVIGGIGWAISERLPNRASHRASPLGVALAVGGALGQAAGLVLAKPALANYGALPATQIRIVAGSVGFIVILTVLRRWRPVIAALTQRRAMLELSAGALLGPFLGVALSLAAIQRTETGVAAAIMAITPVVLIPMVVVIYRDRVGLGGVLGALVAVAGVALLFQ